MRTKQILHARLILLHLTGRLSGRQAARMGRFIEGHDAREGAALVAALDDVVEGRDGARS